MYAERPSSPDDDVVRELASSQREKEREREYIPGELIKELNGA